MEIIVEGSASEYFKPDKVDLVLTFYKKSSTYESVLELGVDAVNSFINIILLNNGFTKDDMKTRSYSIKEDSKYSETTRSYYKDGFVFNQYAKLTFDYDKDKLSKLMSEISSLSDAPNYQIVFGLKDEKRARRSIIGAAYKDAFDEALAIAASAGYNEIKCMKVDFKPFTTNYVSHTEYEGFAKAARFGAASANDIANTFTPEDIEVNEKLYCLFETI